MVHPSDHAADPATDRALTENLARLPCSFTIQAMKEQGKRADRYLTVRRRASPLAPGRVSRRLADGVGTPSRSIQWSM